MPTLFSLPQEKITVLFLSTYCTFHINSMDLYSISSRNLMTWSLSIDFQSFDLQKKSLNTGVTISNPNNYSLDFFPNKLLAVLCKDAWSRKNQSRSFDCFYVAEELSHIIQYFLKQIFLILIFSCSASIHRCPTHMLWPIHLFRSQRSLTRYSIFDSLKFISGFSFRIACIFNRSR